MAYLPKLKPAVGNQLGGMPERRPVEVSAAVSAAFNWQIPIAYNGKNKDVSAQDGTPSRVRFRPDGLIMYVFGSLNKTIYQYALSIAWDVSSAVYDSKSKLVTDQDASPISMFFSIDGSKMYVSGAGNDTIYQYALSTDWDVSTATYDSKSKLVSGEDTTPLDLHLTDDGLRMFMFGDATQFVYQYTLSTAWDVSTATYDSKSKSLTDISSDGKSMAFSPDISKMYMMKDADDSVYQYTLSTPGDISTASYDSGLFFHAGDEDTEPTGITFSKDGAQMYVTGQTTDSVYQYDIGSYT